MGGNGEERAKNGEKTANNDKNNAFSNVRFATKAERKLNARTRCMDATSDAPRLFNA